MERSYRGIFAKFGTVLGKGKFEGWRDRKDVCDGVFGIGGTLRFG